MDGRTLRVYGTVQGVGFRPFVYRLATEEGLAGEVCNTPDGVAINVFGPPHALRRFGERLYRDAPPLARIERIEEADSTAPAPERFLIAPNSGTRGSADVTADAALCADCYAELFDPADRRSRYPFINCTNCGPRFSIVEAVPYDRAATTMRHFGMCAECAAEYADPSNRRFHAEPIACRACGPTLSLIIDDRSVPGDPIKGAVACLREGGILGVMGLGGFHLAVRADDAPSVSRLRARKRRPSKPFALMMRDLSVASRYVDLTPAHCDALKGTAAPIVLAPARVVPDSVAPGLSELGVMLPATPLHALLMAPFDEALVMTSANISGEPPVTTFAAAKRQLGAVADAWLVHDRAIANRVDDSVVGVRGGAPRLLRRARGYAPAPIPLHPSFAPHPPVLALGGDLKNVFGLADRGRVVLSPHLGDLSSRTVASELERTVDLVAAMSGFAAAHVVVDAHPGYRTKHLGERWANRLGIPCHIVGHHHAHIAACLAENGYPRNGPPVLALTLDGVGAGETGELFGCELWRADYQRAERIGGLRPTAWLGGDKAATDPWRNLLARLDDAFGPRPADWPPALAQRLANRPIDTLLSARRAGINTPNASSAGRLFDAVAAALPLCDAGQDYEGEAPMRLEALADRGTTEGYQMTVTETPHGAVLDPAPLWPAIDRDLRDGATARDISSRFHRGFADGLLRLVEAASPERGSAIALSGGTFNNKIVSDLVREGCERLRLRVLEHRLVPAGDGGLALGQAAIAIARLRAEENA